MNKRIGKNDLIFISILFLVLLLILILFYSFTNKKGEFVIVTVDGDTFGKYSLTKNQSIEIIDENKNITNYLVIEDGYASMIEASCPDKLCVKQKKISKNNETIVCLPNKVVVTIVSNENSDLDAVAQ